MLEELAHLAESIELAKEIAENAVGGGNGLDRWDADRLHSAWITVHGLLDGAAIELADLQLLADTSPSPAAAGDAA